MNNTLASLAVVVILSLLSHSYISHCESKALLEALGQTEAGYKEFMNKSSGGKKLYEYVDPNTVGVFRINDESFACGRISTPLPTLLRKK